MKRNVFFLSLFITAFLFSSVLSVRPVEALSPSLQICKDSVAWNTKKDQVKNKDRRKYLGCLAGALADEPEHTNFTTNPKYPWTWTPAEVFKCIAKYNPDFPKPWTKRVKAKEWENLEDEVLRVPNSKRRETIRCFEDILENSIHLR
jgi:hypothetical protein